MLCPVTYSRCKRRQRGGTSGADAGVCVASSSFAGDFLPERLQVGVEPWCTRPFPNGRWTTSVSVSQLIALAARFRDAELPRGGRIRSAPRNAEATISMAGFGDRHGSTMASGEARILELVLRERSASRVRPSRDDGQCVRHPRVVAVAGGKHLLDRSWGVGGTRCPRTGAGARAVASACSRLVCRYRGYPSLLRSRRCCFASFLEDAASITS